VAQQQKQHQQDVPEPVTAAAAAGDSSRHGSDSDGWQAVEHLDAGEWASALNVVHRFD
jgi:hypothetical protein